MNKQNWFQKTRKTNKIFIKVYKTQHFFKVNRFLFTVILWHSKCLCARIKWTASDVENCERNFLTRNIKAIREEIKLDKLFFNLKRSTETSQQKIFEQIRARSIGYVQRDHSDVFMYVHITFIELNCLYHLTISNCETHFHSPIVQFLSFVSFSLFRVCVCIFHFICCPCHVIEMSWRIFDK